MGGNIPLPSHHGRRKALERGTRQDGKRRKEHLLVHKYDRGYGIRSVKLGTRYLPLRLAHESGGFKVNLSFDKSAFLFYLSFFILLTAERFFFHTGSVHFGRISSRDIIGLGYLGYVMFLCVFLFSCACLIISVGGTFMCVYVCS